MGYKMFFYTKNEYVKKGELYSISTKLLTLCDPVALTVPGREILSNIGGIGFKVGPISPKTGKLALPQTSVNIIWEELEFIHYHRDFHVQHASFKQG